MPKTGPNLLEVTGARDLVEHAAAGDAAAFAELYARHQAEVFSIALRRTGHWQTAEDICSKTWLRAWMAIGEFRWTGVSPAGWLQTIAANLIRDHRKACAQRKTITTGDISDFDRAASDDPADAAIRRCEIAALASTRTIVRTCLDRLVPRQRDCLILRFVCGLAPREVGAALGIGEGAAKALQSRAVRGLTALLAEHGITGPEPRPSPFPGDGVA